MKKSFLITVLAVIIALCSFGLFACSDNGGSGSKDPGVQMKKYSNDDYYTVYDYGDSEKLTDGKLVLSETANIGRIQEGAFEGNETIKELVIPSTVKIIDQGAFAGMRKLEKITLPFIGKTAIADAYFGATGENVDKSTDFERTFGYMFGSEEFTGSLVMTQKYNDATGSEQVYYVPETLTTVIFNSASEYQIPMFAFSGNTVIEKVVLNDKVTAIGQNAFEACTYLNEISGNAKVANVYDKAFYGCTDLKAISGYTADLKTVGNSAFENSGLTEVTLTSGVTYGERAFAGSKVAKVNIQTNVPYACFYGCEKITEAKVTVSGTINFDAYSFANLAKPLTVNKDEATIVTAEQWNGESSTNSTPNVTIA